jgi:hypothetical protein
MSVMSAPEIPTLSTAPRRRTSPRGAMYPRPLVFVHIPKAAGTTLAEIIVRQYMGGRGFRFTGDTQQWEDFKSAPKEQNGKYDVLHGHVHYGVHEYLPEPATYVTMLRDPVDRVVSHYHFVLSNPDHYLHQKIAGRRFTLHDYAVTRASHELDNDQVRWLCVRHHFDVPVGQVSREMVEEAKWNLANGFAVVGLMERFAESLACLARAFGWEGVELPARRNVNKDRPPLDQIAPETINAIREINRYDIELYDFAQALFEEQMVRLGVPREAPAPPMSVSPD